MAHIQFNVQLFLSFFTLAAVASLCGATALPPVPAKYWKHNATSPGTLSKRGVYCETSGGSPPRRRHCRGQIHPDPRPRCHDGCCQNNQSGSYCTTMMCEGTACVGICSDGSFALYCDTCLDAGNGLLDIADSCSSTGLSVDGQTRLMASVLSFSTLKGSLEAILPNISQDWIPV
ncbi:hypothetical protein B0H14DRAFT_2628501 [Mycena olivaceomarginata]|nr:hypothetical protein B0H14DRAFT_2628501 [Mycena olivaceomarginata]